MQQTILKNFPTRNLITNPLKTIKESALKSWKKFGFYFLSNKMNRVLIKSSVEKTYLLKVLFLHTGAYVLQGPPDKVHNAFLRLPVPFKNMPQLTLCLSENLKESLQSFNSTRESCFAKIIGDIFNWRLQDPENDNLYSSYSSRLQIPYFLQFLFKFIDSYIQNIVNHNRSLYSDMLGKGVRNSLTPSLSSLKDIEKSFKKGIIPAFLEDYVKNLEKNGWKSILASHIYKSFLIWISKMTDFTASYSSPVRKEFFREILSHVGVKLSFCNGYETINFDSEAFKNLQAIRDQEDLSLLEKDQKLKENLETSYCEYKESLYSSQITEDPSTKSDFFNSLTFELRKDFDISRIVPQHILQPSYYESNFP